MYSSNIFENGNTNSESTDSQTSKLPKKYIFLGITITLLLAAGVTLGVIYLGKGKVKDDKRINEVIKTPEELKKGKIERIRSIISKLINLGLTVEMDININDPKRSSKDSDKFNNVSDPSYIRLSEVVAIVEDFENKEPKFTPGQEAYVIKRFKELSEKYKKRYSDLDNFLERYGYFRVNYEEIELHNKSIFY